MSSDSPSRRLRTAVVVVVAVAIATSAVVGGFWLSRPTVDQPASTVAAVSIYRDDWNSRGVLVLHKGGAVSRLALEGDYPIIELSTHGDRLAALRFVPSSEQEEGLPNKQYEPTLSVVDIASGSVLSEIPIPRNQAFVQSMKWAPDDETIAIVSWGGVDLVTVDTGSLTAIDRDLGSLLRAGGITWSESGSDLVILTGGVFDVTVLTGGLVFGVSLLDDIASPTTSLIPVTYSR